LARCTACMQRRRHMEWLYNPQRYGNFSQYRVRPYPSAMYTNLHCETHDHIYHAAILITYSQGDYA
jgi:hypothetical protein